MNKKQLKELIREEVQSHLNEQKKGPPKEYLQVASDILDVAENIASFQISTMKSYGAHDDEIKGLLGDLKDVLKVAQLVEYEQPEKAKKKAESLDTAVREEIPEQLWEL